MTPMRSHLPVHEAEALTASPDSQAVKVEHDAATSERFRTSAIATVLIIAVAWVLYIGKGIFVPIVFSALVVYVIDGVTRLVFKLPVVGRLLPPTLGYTSRPS